MTRAEGNAVQPAAPVANQKNYKIWCGNFVGHYLMYCLIRYSIHFCIHCHNTNPIHLQTVNKVTSNISNTRKQWQAIFMPLRKFLLTMLP